MKCLNVIGPWNHPHKKEEIQFSTLQWLGPMPFLCITPEFGVPGKPGLSPDDVPMDPEELKQVGFPEISGSQDLVAQDLQT